MKATPLAIPIDHLSKKDKNLVWSTGTQPIAVSIQPPLIICVSCTDMLLNKNSAGKNSLIVFNWGIFFISFILPQAISFCGGVCYNGFDEA